jgi:hypothetical protein
VHTLWCRHRNAPAAINVATKEITLTTDKPELDDAQLAAVAIDTVGTGIFEYLGVLTF